MRKKLADISCSECGWPIPLRRIVEGQGLICPSCGLEVAFHSFKIDERLYESLCRRAREEGVSIDELTEEAFEEYIEEHERGRRLSHQDS